MEASISSVRSKNPSPTQFEKSKAERNGEVEAKLIDSISLTKIDREKAISITAQSIFDEINALIKEEYSGVETDFSPENNTPEKTSERILSGVAALFPIFQQQNPNLEGEELVNAFIDTVSGGVERGYKDAVKALDALGALGVEGVEEGIGQTMDLVREGLSTLRETLRERLGVAPKEEEAPTAELPVGQP